MPLRGPEHAATSFNKARRLAFDHGPRAHTKEIDLVWEILAWARYILAAALLALGLLPALFLGLTGLAAFFFREPGARGAPEDTSPDGEKVKAPRSRTALRIAVVIPAHDEQLLIGETVRSVFQQEYDRSRYCVMVVADNCKDATASRARTEGARVLERAGNPGKGQALHTAFEALLREDWDAFLVMDADSRPHRAALRAVSRAMNAGAAVVQLFYGVLNPEASRRTAAMELALASFNGLRPRGKAAWGWSCGIFGNGFCLSREVLQKVPHGAHSIVEDLEYHLKLLESGYRVRFLNSVWVKAQMPESGRDAASQRIRWERGRLQLIRTRAPGLLKDLARGRLTAIQALIDVAIPPASIIALASLGALILGPLFVRVGALIALALLALHYLLATALYGSFMRSLRVMAYLPWYLIWKTLILVFSFVRYPNLPWVRTRRVATHDSTDSSANPP